MSTTLTSSPPGAAPGSLVTYETYHRTSHRLFRLSRVDVALAGVLFVVAIAARWPLIARGETLLHPDEAVVGIMAQDIAAGQRFPIYFYGQRYMGALEAYVIAAISPLFHDPIHALRMGPALFFAAFVALQYLMLARWFGRKGGLIGATCLLAGAPMFAQWSISARGGYIENLTWGTAILWAYMEWFALTSSVPVLTRQRRLFLFGLLIGSGFWINPAVVFFLVPVAMHAGLNSPFLEQSGLRKALAPFRRGGLVVFALLAVLILNVCWSVIIDEGQVHTTLLMGAIPPQAAIAILCAIPTIFILKRRLTILPWIRCSINANVHLIFGALVGALPAIFYVVRHLAHHLPMEPALPLGFRPIWQTGETLVYFIRGLPLFFGADPRPFVDHVTVGRDRSVMPLDVFSSAIATAANHLVIGAAIACLALLLWTHRREIEQLLSMKSRSYSPAILLILGAASTVALYLLGGCSCSFTTIRYLLPLWAFIPGLAASIATNSRARLAGSLAPVALCLAWALGQFCLIEQVGRPHPLHGLSRILAASGPQTAKAEILDAQLLSFLSGQRCKVAEFQPFWPRLAHYTRPCRLPAWLCRYGRPDQGPTGFYIVNTHDWDRTSDWTDLDSPGPPPPETQRSLWPVLRRALSNDPGLIQSRRQLVPGYDLVQLRRPLAETCP